MGNVLGDQKPEEAIKKLEDMVWENDGNFEFEQVVSVLRNCNITTHSTVDDIVKFMSTKEEEHTIKMRAFLNNNNMHSHHMKIARRYARVAFITKNSLWLY